MQWTWALRATLPEDDKNPNRDKKCDGCKQVGHIKKDCPCKKQANVLEDAGVEEAPIGQADIQDGEVHALEQKFGGSYITSLEEILPPKSKQQVRAQEGYSWNDSTTPLAPHPSYQQHEGKRCVNGTYDMRRPEIVADAKFAEANRG